MNSMFKFYCFRRWFNLIILLCSFANVHCNINNEQKIVNDKVDGISIDNINNNNNIEWMRTENMDHNRLYLLNWTVKENNIIFRVTVNTIGVIGLGFSHKINNKKIYDYVIVWVDNINHVPNILDCHSVLSNGGGDGNNDNDNFDDVNDVSDLKRMQLIKDDTQNYEIIMGKQNETYTVVEFTRPLETCDPYDIVINDNTTEVIWSYGDLDPIIGNAINIGNEFGKKILHLLTPLLRLQPHKPDDDVKKLDLIVNQINITSDLDTLFWCKIFPIAQEKHHIIGYEPLLTKDTKTNNIPLIHHMTLYECKSSAAQQWEHELVKKDGDYCDRLITASNRDSCITPIATWASGSTGQFFPEHIGFPMGGINGSIYYLLEIHYDNPKAKNIIDQSGFRLYYTKRLRKYDGGIMIIGVSVSDTHMLPPKQKQFHCVGICGKNYTQNFLPAQTGINIISVALHSHQAGRIMELKHIHNDIEQKPIVKDLNYNYNYLQFRQLQIERNVLPGDYLILKCTYNTFTRTRPTFGGYSTKQEICLSFITYYPKIDLVGCYSMTPVKEYFNLFDVRNFSGYTMNAVENLILSDDSNLNSEKTIKTFNQTDGNNNNNNNNIIMMNMNVTDDTTDLLQKQSILYNLIISEPLEFRGRTFLHHLNELPWHSASFVNEVQKRLLFGDHMTFCINNNPNVSVPKEIIFYPTYKLYENLTQKCSYNTDLFMYDFSNVGNHWKFNQFNYLILVTILLILI